MRRKTDCAISAEIKDSAARAAEKRLKPAEYEGGSFSVSNLGMFGIDQFTAVINPPQAAILAVGGPVKKLIMADGGPVEQTDMRVTLSCDHRAIDGAIGAQFLATLADYVENAVAVIAVKRFSHKLRNFAPDPGWSFAQGAGNAQKHAGFADRYLLDHWLVPDRWPIRFQSRD